MAFGPFFTMNFSVYESEYKASTASLNSWLVFGSPCPSTIRKLNFGTLTRVTAFVDGLYRCLRSARRSNFFVTWISSCPRFATQRTRVDAANHTVDHVFAFERHADFPGHRYRRRVGGTDHADEPLESERVARVVDDPASGFRRQALAPARPVDEIGQFHLISPFYRPRQETA